MKDSFQSGILIVENSSLAEIESPVDAALFTLVHKLFGANGWDGQTLVECPKLKGNMFHSLGNISKTVYSKRIESFLFWMF